MKKYKLNKEYAERELKMYHSGNPAEILKEAEKRLNEQAADCAPYITAWALQGMSIERVHEELTDWNNHTLACHMEVVRDIYDEATSHGDPQRQLVTFHRSPCEAEIRWGDTSTHYISVPFLESINKYGLIEKRIKYRGMWYSF